MLNKTIQLIGIVSVLIISFAYPQSKMDLENLVDRGELLFAPNDDKPFNGNVFLFHDNGQKAINGRLRNGLKIGKWTYWTLNGSKLKEGTFKDGIIVNGDWFNLPDSLIIKGILINETPIEDVNKIDLMTSSFDSLSYTLGMDIGENFKRESIEVNYDAFMTGFRHVNEEKDALLTKAERDQTIRNLQQSLRKQQQERAENNVTEGKAFLESNKANPGVTETPTGLQYRVINEGDGESPTASDQVKVHYKGTLIDGTEFDSSYGRGEPATFRVNGVIKGWQEGIQLMKVGAKFEFFIPSSLAYGPRPSPKIPANSTLVFEVELLNIIK